MNMKEKFARINLSKLPDELKTELDEIKEGSENFDPDYVEIYQKNFDLLYEMVEKNYPEALGKSATVKKVKPSSKKKVEKKAAPKKAPTKKGDVVGECRDVLKDAGYDITKRKSKKGGKPMVVRKKRQEKTIIKERVEDSFKPILKDISGSKEKDEKFAAMQKSIESIQGMFSTLLQKLNSLAEDNATDKVAKIEKLLKEILN